MLLELLDIIFLSVTSDTDSAEFTITGKECDPLECEEGTNETQMPSNSPSSSPSEAPSLMPSQFPTVIPSNTPSTLPSITPSHSPAILPTALPPTSTCGNVKCLGCNCCGVGTTFSSITLQCELDCSSTSASCTDIQYDTCYQSPECAEDGCCAPGTVFEDESPQNPILGTCVAPSGSCPP